MHLPGNNNFSDVYFFWILIDFLETKKVTCLSLWLWAKHVDLEHRMLDLPGVGFEPAAFCILV